MKISDFVKLISLIFLVLVLVLPNFSGFALPGNSEGGRRGLIVFAQEDCKTKEECEALWEKLQEEIKKLEGVIGQTEQEKRTLQNQINVLRSRIQQLDLQIQQSNIVIKDLGYQIKDTEGSIEQTSLKIEDSRAKLAAILQIIYEEDQTSIIEVLLSNANLSDFFDNLMALETLNLKSQEFLGEIKNLKQTLEGQKQSLDTEKGDLEKVVKIQTLQKQESQTTRSQQEYFLKLTEAQYQQYLKEKEATEKRAAEIRARIFQLFGVSDVDAPTFGQAYEIAKWVEVLTGVRPAFLLAVLQQESAIGKNVGQCYLPRDPNEIQKTRAMAAPPGSKRNDVSYFLQITQELGFDPYSTTISCPMSFGWGGAMGPAQFIPTTWMTYKGRLELMLGRKANPWSIQDAFLAAGLYLSDYGAKSKTRDGEWRAAMIYFSGSTTNPAFYFYANSVLRIADGFENDIKILEASK